jgi:hypothetical protein
MEKVCGWPVAVEESTISCSSRCEGAHRHDGREEGLVSKVFSCVDFME